MNIQINIIIIILMSCMFLLAKDQKLKQEFNVDKQYLLFPVSNSAKKQNLTFHTKKFDTYFDIRLATISDSIDYWTFIDVSKYIGQKITLSGVKSVDLKKGFELICLNDEIKTDTPIYSEKLRPQVHFSTKRGWINDPNGLVYYDGEYHLFYQHNPFDWNWGNMHWGHAVSSDLVHWEQLPDVLHPDKFGTMFSGSAVVDDKNTSGFQKGKEKVIVAAYTADLPGGKGESQHIAYSNDRGRSFTKYENNSVLAARQKFGTSNERDPKIFWYEPNKNWVMALFETSGISIYNSDNLKDWTYKSHIKGFWECPELFELPVDGNINNKKWILTGASGTYMVGSFDGEKFIPEGGKYRTTNGSMYAAQTFNNTPDGRRIQIGWGRIESRNMPFNQMMMFPTVLTLRTTNEGVCVFSEPVNEIEKLHKKKYKWSQINMSEANENLKEIQSDLIHMKATIEIPTGHYYTLFYKDNWIVTFDGNYDKMNQFEYIQGNPGEYIFDIEVIIDRTSVETFFDGGKMVSIRPLDKPKKEEGLRFQAVNDDLIFHNLEVYEMESIWK